ncbi:HNH endonuclease family protein [Pseudactinotalea sp. Z1739]|uniref:HNH endonuclease family protein n=1 Tax=Pseudactinotalea sp. Z1739 TaxID=3413028 RepID=UPI003C7ACAD4
MRIELKRISVRDLVADYEDNDELGVRAYGGKLDVRPPYQREFVYKDKQRDAVIETVRRDFPLNVMYWSVIDKPEDDGVEYEIIDGQQRTISICQYVEGDFSILIDGHQLAFHNLQEDQQQQILDYELMVYLCEGTDSEKLDWFKTINIAGEELTDQELRNAVYHGPWVSAAKRYFSKNGCPAYAIASDYMTGSPIRQDYLQTAIEWINDGKVDEYMRDHQHDTNANELWLYFKGVIDWVEAIFPKKRAQMRSVKWGPLYNKYKDAVLDPIKLEDRVATLMGDIDVKNKRGIYEYLLGGEEATKLLDVRVFDERTKLAAYVQQTTQGEADGTSNCPMCASGNNTNATRIYELSEMDADHVTAWSKGGASDLANCEMLCVPHNRSKGNR